MAVKVPRGLTHARRLYGPEQCAERIATARHELGDRPGRCSSSSRRHAVRDAWALRHLLGD